MNNKPLIISVALLAIGALLLALINRDALYVDASVFFFVLCIAYASWCKRL